MKTVFINYTRYEHDEFIVIHHIGTDEDTSIQEFKKNLKDFLSFGPDDCHSFRLVQVDLKNKDYNRLMKLPLEDSLEGDDHDFFVELSDDYDFDCNLVCYEDNSGNYEIVNMYCEDHNLDSDDDDVWDEVNDLLRDDEDLYETYINKYVESTC